MVGAGVASAGGVKDMVGSARLERVKDLVGGLGETGICTDVTGFCGSLGRRVFCVGSGIFERKEGSVRCW